MPAEGNPLVLLLKGNLAWKNRQASDPIFADIPSQNSERVETNKKGDLSPFFYAIMGPFDCLRQSVLLHCFWKIDPYIHRRAFDR